MFAFHSRLFPRIFLAACCAILVLLWLPGLKYPVVSDTLVYALLGKSLWTAGTYILDGVPHVKFLPAYPFFAYPLVWIFGITSGMKLASLFSGMGVLIAAYALLRRMFSRGIAVCSVALLLFHHGFIVMAILGASDLLCTLFFLLSLLCYLRAEKNQLWYIPCGFLLGLSLLTRYNAVPLLLFYPAYTLLARRHHIHSVWFWTGMLLGGGLFLLWFVRKALLTGSPLSNDYTAEFAERSMGTVENAWMNIVYYSDPLKNILPILFLSSLYWIIRRRGRPLFLTGAMSAVWAIFLVWPVRNIRYLIPGYVILIGFGVAGLFDLIKRSGRFKIPVAAAIAAGLVSTHALASCLYAYGACNAAFDRTIGGIQKNLGLASEGFYAWHLGRVYINKHAEAGATVIDDPSVFSPRMFRSDLRVTDDRTACPAYMITQQAELGKAVIFRTEDWPIIYVVRMECGD
ncbi:glycosyltransferase family 39 protein [Candidatus Peregrinibacteria bacterium]|nr:glycosyltransferase family 39 protein [Candidatus Peregrinibacteria bacterium]